MTVVRGSWIVDRSSNHPGDRGQGTEDASCPSRSDSASECRGGASPRPSSRRTDRDWLFAHKELLLPTYVQRGLTIVRGDGAHVYDDMGRCYLDLTSGYGAASLGYGHPALTRALTEQLGALHVLHCSFVNDVRVRASRALVEHCGGGLARVYWSNSGAEAIEAALKVAALATAKKRFVACAGGYHGKTLGALALTHDERYRAPFEPLPWEVTHVSFGDGEALAAAVDERTAAVVLEPIQGESGVIVPPAGYLRAARAICDARGALLVLDEVQTGAGRTGAFLACHHEDVWPEIVCLGKGLAGGIPVGATLVTETIASAVPRGAHTSTFGGNPLACAGALAVIEILDDAFLADLAAKGAAFTVALQTIASRRIIAVRGRGLLVAVELAGDRDRVLKDLQRRGVLALPAGPSAVRFLPPYVVTVDELLGAATTLGEVLT
jgi:LysW-gamma-L-lysine/LysW-L-ornithine aminotransferase